MIKSNCCEFGSKEMLEHPYTYTTRVIEILANGDAVVELPPQLCEKLGWNIGDALDISEKDGKIYIKKLDEDDNDVSST